MFVFKKSTLLPNGSRVDPVVKVEGEVNEIAAQIMNVGRSSVVRAARVKAKDPEVFKDLKDGKITLEDARRKTQTEKPRDSHVVTSNSAPIQQDNPQYASQTWADAVVDHYKNLRIEITRRREENRDERSKRRWNAERIIKRFQTELLDCIEQELDAGCKLITGQLK